MQFWRTSTGRRPVLEFLRDEKQNGEADLSVQFGGQVDAVQREWLERGRITYDGVSFARMASRGFDGEVRVKVRSRQARFFFSLDASVPALVFLDAFWKVDDSWKRINVPKAAKRWAEYLADPELHGRP